MTHRHFQAPHTGIRFLNLFRRIISISRIWWGKGLRSSKGCFDCIDGGRATVFDCIFGSFLFLFDVFYGFVCEYDLYTKLNTIWILLDLVGYWNQFNLWIIKASFWNLYHRVNLFSFFLHPIYTQKMIESPSSMLKIKDIENSLKSLSDQIKILGRS